MKPDDTYEQILARNKEWVAQTLELDPHYFDKLGAGQSPLILYFGCSDSRIPINILTGTGPGDIFIHRNVANQFQSNDLCAHATLEYALMVLNIRQVVVCGHESCSGILGALDENAPSYVQNWISPIVALRHENQSLLDGLVSKQEKQTFLAKLNIHQQLENIRASTIYQALPDGDKPQLHGWFFEITTGKLTVID